MATKDFKIRNGLNVGGDITYRGGTITVFDSESVINIIKDVGINESDLATVATLRNDVDSDSAAIQQNLTDLTSDISTINSRLDSDETQLQTINTAVGVLQARADSDETAIQTIRTDLDTLDTNLTARLDSDSTIIQGLRTELDTAVARLDSDETALQSLDTTLNTLSTKVDSIEAGLDSETARIQLLLLSTDSDALSIAGLKQEADSDAAAIAELLRQADSDAAAIQALNTTLTADISALTARADSDETAIQTLRTDLDTLDTNLTARLDSDSIIVQDLQTQIDTVNTTVSGHTTDISTIQNRLDSDDTKLQDAITRIETLEAAPAFTDSDYKVVADLRNDIDSDSTKIQALTTLYENLGGSDALQVSTFTFTSPANDSEFTGSDDDGKTLGYVIGRIHVYLNGILLTETTDYIANNGSSVTLVNAPDSDDILTVVKFLGTVQAGFDSDQIVTIITENTNPDTVARLDSDETKLQDHSIRLETLEARADSDETAIQTINTAVGVLQARADSDETQLQVLNTSINGLTARLDSDSTAIQDNNTRIVALEARADSDELQLQAINTSLSSRITDLETGADSDRAAIAQLRRDADSDSIEIQSIRSAVDSDYALFNNKISLFNGLTDSDLTTVSNLRNDVDSDSTKLQALETTVAGLSSTALADSDISVITGAKSLTTNQIIGGGVTDVDTFSTSLFRSVKYVVVASSDSDATYQADEILVVHDGTYAYLTQYAQVSTSDSELVTYDVTISSDNVLLQATPTRNNVRFDAQRLHVSVANSSILDLTIVPDWSSPVETPIRDSDVGGFSFYGRGVAISNDGNYAAFGADARDDSDGSGNTVSNVGGVYIYKRSGSTWTREALLTADSENANDYLGYDVSFNEDGTYCVAGCQTSGQPNKVRVFTRSGSTWSQQAELMASNAETYDIFGEDVDISADGNYIAVAARQEDDSDNSTANCGALYIFKRDGVTWSEEAILRADDRSTNDYLGDDDVSLNSDGSIVVAGATGAEAAYVFTRTGSTWSQQAKLTASNTESGDTFGQSAQISKDGNYIIVGAIFEDDSDNSVANRGAAYIFKKDGSSWSEEAILYSSDGASNDRFGASVAINSNGKYVAVGATFHDITGTNNEGAVYIFQRDGTTWTQIKKLAASDGQQSDQLGSDVDLSDDAVYLVTSAPFEDGGDGDPFGQMGQGYIFDATP